MKHTLFAAAAGITLLAGGAAAAGDAPPGLDVFRKAFASAVRSHDLIVIAGLSGFPLSVDVYGFGPKLSREDFLGSKDYYQGWFYGGDAEIVKCLATAPIELQTKPDFPHSPWVIDCNGNEYYFGMYQGEWRFMAYANINE